MKNIHINESASVNISIFKKMGINIEPKFYDKFMENLIIMVKYEANQALSKFSVQDILGDKSVEFFETYLKYFDFTAETSTQNKNLSINTKFLDLNDKYWISGIFIQNNKDKILDKCKVFIVSEQEEFDKAMKNLKNIFELFLCHEFTTKLKYINNEEYDSNTKHLKQKNIFDLIGLMKKPFEKYLNYSGTVKDTVKTRELLYFFIKYKKYLNEDIRYKVYEKQILFLKNDMSVFSYHTMDIPFPRENTPEVKMYLINMFLSCFKAIENKYFSKNSFDKMEKKLLELVKDYNE